MIHATRDWLRWHSAKAMNGDIGCSEQEGEEEGRRKEKRNRLTPY